MSGKARRGYVWLIAFLLFSPSWAKNSSIEYSVIVTADVEESRVRPEEEIRVRVLIQNDARSPIFVPRDLPPVLGPATAAHIGFRSKSGEMVWNMMGESIPESPDIKDIPRKAVKLAPQALYGASVFALAPKKLGCYQAIAYVQSWRAVKGDTDDRVLLGGFESKPSNIFCVVK
jgi:hypothetical protein